MKMKLIGSFLVASMLFFFTAFAHGDKLTPQEKAAKKTAWMKANLGLSDDQVKQVEPLNLAYAQKNYDKAIDYLKQAEKLNPKDFIVLNNIAQAYKLKGDKANAIKYYELTEKYGDEQAKQQAKEILIELKK